MIRTRIKNLIIGSSKAMTGFGQKKKKDYRRKPDKRRFAPPASVARGTCFLTWFRGRSGQPVIDTFEEVAMGDKGKKDKEKSRKQKIMKQTQEAKKAQEKFTTKFPLSKA